MEKQKKQHKGFYVEKGSFFVHAAVTILALSMVFRLLGTLHCWGDMFQLATQIALPVGSAVLMILFLLFFGRIALWTTILPVLGGAAFFILAEVDHNPSWPMFICIALAFLDIELGRVSGLDLCREMLRIRPRTNVIFLTAFREYSLDAWDTGASGFLLKPLEVDAVKKQLAALRYPVGGLL